MRKPHWKALGTIALAICWNGFIACATDGTRRGDAQGYVNVARVRPDTGVELRVALTRDTIAAQDRRPVEVVYYVVNGPTKTVFDNGPDRFAFIVRRLDGTPADNDRGTPAADGVAGPQVKMVLPGGSWLGQTQDLRCIKGAGYDELPPGQTHDCEIRYRLDSPGTYNVIVMYHDGRVLADSARLVVK